MKLDIQITKLEPALFHGDSMWYGTDSDGHEVQIAIDPFGNIRVRRSVEKTRASEMATLYEAHINDLPSVVTYGDLKVHLESVGVSFADGVTFGLRWLGGVAP